ncbi:MAG: DUF4838 domain-containing protein [Lentisphaerae bacterium]|nr:DUF4838 domain-containing protein [Lentisphaerota bacterium]
MQSGDDWLVLLGDDTVFEPQGIYAESRNDWINVKQQQWEEAAGIDWGNPIGAGIWNKYNKDLGLWRFDEKGTLNAVYGFLGSLGVRWYMPGELGEIVPEMSTIELPKVDLTVRPDCDIRMVAYARYGHGAKAMDEIMWSLRQGVNDPYGYHTHHGIANVSRSKVLREKHPDYFALYNNERQVLDKTANVCLSSEGLFQENLRFVRFMFDMYDVPIVSVWPDDGFSSMCQCDLCKGKDTPERGRQGVMSDYVWDYVNRMAIEIEKSHPGKLISCGAYSTYWLPPTKLDKLNSNIVVYVVNGRRRYPQDELDVAALAEWKRLTGNKIITFMNVGGGANTPRLFAGDMQTIKELVMGEDMWPPFAGGMLANPGFNHLNYYISGLYQWDTDQDIDAVLDEYYRLFYGPAARAMAEFVDYYEAHQREMAAIDSAPIIKKALDLFEVAKGKVDPASVYGQRLALFEEGLTGRKKRYEVVKAGRVNVPTYTMTGPAAEMTEIVIDGRLDEKFWQQLPGTLKISENGEEPVYSTRFRIGVHGNNLYVGILCQDIPGQPINAFELKKDDYGIWEGDVVEILLETPENSYYQIAANALGSVADLDRGAGGLSAATGWDAQAAVAGSIDEAAGTWSVEMRIPFTPSSQDPLHEVIGPPPSKGKPWHFNVCRQRARNQRAELEMSAFSPTGSQKFHEILKFGRLE